MPSNKFSQNEAGRFLTKGLDEKKFQQVFKLIEKAQAKNRRSAKRTLTPHTLSAKTKSDIAKLGAKQDGTPFTVDDLKAFAADRDNFKKKYDSKTDGITYAQIVSGSRSIDIKRANNQVNDGSGITKARLNAIKNNEIIVRVKASDKSLHDEHMVKLRFDEWADYLHNPPANDYQKAVKSVCKGRISIACDCGRHQYWYRYLATMGRYAIAPPSEFSFPKIRNPNLKGIACKHVLKAVVMVQSAAWQRLLAKQMEIQAKKIGYGDDRKLHHTLTADEAKAAARNRSTVINKSKVDKAALRDFNRYKKSQEALAKKIKADDKLAKKMQLALNRKRKTDLKNKRLQDKNNNQRDVIRAMYGLMKDVYKMQNKTASDAVKDLASKLNLSESDIRTYLK